MKNSARGECRPRLPECPAQGVCDNPLKRYYLHVLQLDKLQSLQYVAARLVTGARKFDYITPVMRELHWLPVRQRIKFKTAVLVFKSLHGLAPAYLSTASGGAIAPPPQ